jgi:hypothetical protein
MTAEESGLAANSAMVSGLGLMALVGFGVVKFESYLTTFRYTFLERTEPVPIFRWSIR